MFLHWFSRRLHSRRLCNTQISPCLTCPLQFGCLFWSLWNDSFFIVVIGLRCQVQNTVVLLGLRRNQSQFHVTINNQQSTINNQQSTINNQQSTINNQQSTINNQQSTSNKQQATTTHNDRRLSQACPLFCSWQPLPSGESSDDCARGGDTSSSRTLRPWPRRCTTLHEDRGRPGPGRRRARRSTRPSSGRLLLPSRCSSVCPTKSPAGGGLPAWQSRRGHRSGFRGTPWSSLPTACRSFRCSMFLCSRRWTSWWPYLLATMRLFLRRSSKCPRFRVHSASRVQFFAHRRWRNSWWKCQCPVLKVTIMAPIVDIAGRTWYWLSRPDGRYTWWLAGTSHHQGTPRRGSPPAQGGIQMLGTATLADVIAVVAVPVYMQSMFMNSVVLDSVHQQSGGSSSCDTETGTDSAYNAADRWHSTGAVLGPRCRARCATTGFWSRHCSTLRSDDFGVRLVCEPSRSV